MNISKLKNFLFYHLPVAFYMYGWDKSTCDETDYKHEPFIILGKKFNKKFNLNRIILIEFYVIIQLGSWL